MVHDVFNLDTEVRSDENIVPISQEVLTFHGLDQSNRHRLLDWLMQVFSAFKVSSHSTFCLAQSLLDRYMVGKWKARECLSRESLPLTALATILISSKYEDVIAISASHLIEKAGHGKFTVQQLFEKELGILQTLSYLINERLSVYHEASLLYSRF